MRVFNHRIVSDGQFKYRALRGHWLTDTRSGKLFGRGAPPVDGAAVAGTRYSGKIGVSCQKRLPGNWDVSRARDRMRERRILKGKLLKVQFKHHVDSECAPDVPEMRFGERCGITRTVGKSDLVRDSDDDAEPADGTNNHQPLADAGCLG